MRKPNWRSAAVGGVMVATLASGCVAIISSDTNDHYEDDCYNCHTVIVYKPSTGDTTVLVNNRTPKVEVCTR